MRTRLHDIKNTNIYAEGQTANRPLRSKGPETDICHGGISCTTSHVSLTTRTYKFRGLVSIEGGVDDAVLQHFSGGRLPTHVQAVCGGVVNLDVLGRGPHHCYRHEREQYHKTKDSKRSEWLEWLKR